MTDEQADIFTRLLERVTALEKNLNPEIVVEYNVPSVTDWVTKSELPSFGTHDAAAFDVRSAVDYVLMPGEYAGINTGTRVKIINDRDPNRLYELQVRPRSGYAIKHGIGIVNSPGTIDQDYRGEIHVIMINMGKEPFVIKRGMKIAQVAVNQLMRVNLKRVTNESYETDLATERGTNAFGSTGTE